MPAHLSIPAHLYLYIYPYMHTPAHLYLYIYPYLHIYTCTSIYTCTWNSSPLS